MFGSVLKVLPTESADTGDVECVVCVLIYTCPHTDVSVKEKKKKTEPRMTLAFLT